MSRRLLRPVAATGFALLAALAAGLLAASHAGACSCVFRSPAEAFAAADVVFTGRAISRTAPSAGPIRSTGDPVTWTFEVSAVHMALREGDRLTTSLCSGTTPFDGITPPLHPPPSEALSRGQRRVVADTCRSRRATWSAFMRTGLPAQKLLLETSLDPAAAAPARSGARAIEPRRLAGGPG
jgi:hypothetical protein